ncbi:MAG: hypothetical protein JW818_14670 [Pirellulales bacterium]|nr:hypothetical protein [Pirellulales bacterium]
MSRFASPHRRSTFAPRRLSVESLEHRNLLSVSGALTLDLVDGDLVITGDDQQNWVDMAVSETPSGNYLVSLRSPGEVFYEGVVDGTGMWTGEISGGIRMDLGDGRDQVFFTGDAHHLEFDMGADSDTLVLHETTVAGALDVDLGDGRDTIQFSSQVDVGGSTMLDGSAGYDFVRWVPGVATGSFPLQLGEVTMHDIEYFPEGFPPAAYELPTVPDFDPDGGCLSIDMDNGDLLISGDDGVNWVQINAPHVQSLIPDVSENRIVMTYQPAVSGEGCFCINVIRGRVYLNGQPAVEGSFWFGDFSENVHASLGDGDDRLQFLGGSFEQVTADMGGGDDRIEFTKASVQNAVLDHGVGDDRLTLNNATFANDLNVQFGPGNDVLHGHNRVEVLGAATLFGGEGSDTIYWFGDVDAEFGSLTLEGFEKLPDEITPLLSESPSPVLTSTDELPLVIDIIDGNLIITGDDNAQQITINSQRTESGAYHVELDAGSDNVYLGQGVIGSGTTTEHGWAGDITGGIQFFLGGGRDQLVVSGTLGGLSIEAGDDRDWITLAENTVIDGDFVLNAGDGNDRLVLINRVDVLGVTSLDGGIGEDAIYWETVWNTIGKDPSTLQLNGFETAPSTLEMLASPVRPDIIEINLVDGNLTITGNEADNRLNLNLSPSSDGTCFVDLPNLAYGAYLFVNGKEVPMPDCWFGQVSGDITIDLGGGDDWLNLNFSRSSADLPDFLANNLNIDLGTGDDFAGFHFSTSPHHVSLAGQTTLDGGDGNDELEFLPVPSAEARERINVTGFETIPSEFETTPPEPPVDDPSQSLVTVEVVNGDLIVTGHNIYEKFYIWISKISEGKCEVWMPGMLDMQFDDGQGLQGGWFGDISGDITVNMDDGDNDVDVAFDTSGADSPVPFTNNLNINLGAGDDTIRFTSINDVSLVGQLTVDGGEGIDELHCGYVTSDDNLEQISVTGFETLPSQFQPPATEPPVVVPSLPNVTVEVVNGNLVITGDEANNLVRVYRDENGNYVVDGRLMFHTCGTSSAQTRFLTPNLINSQDEPVVFTGVTGDVIISTGDGDDEITVEGQIDGNLIIDTGDGNDIVTLWNVSTTGDLTVDTGSGDDRLTSSALLPVGGIDYVPPIEAYRRIDGDVTIKIGDGDDQVSVSHMVHAGDLKILLDGGNDKLSLVDVHVTGTARLDGGSGTNTANLNLFDVNTAGVWNVQGFDNLPTSSPPPVAPPNSNVTAEVVDGNLIITGDDAANRLNIYQNQDGDYVVDGQVIFYCCDGTTTAFLQPTLVNSQEEPGVFSGVTGSVIISTGAGDDWISLNGTINDNLVIDAGGGNDHIELNRVDVVGNLTIKTGDGDDGILIEFVDVGGSATLDTGLGKDAIHLDSRTLLYTTCPDIPIANDVSSESVPEAENIEWEYYPFDFIHLRENASHIHGNMTVSLGAEDDEIHTAGLIIDGDLQIETGEGEDLISIEYADVNGATMLTTSGGNDEVSIRDVNLYGAVTIDMGAGDDAVTFTLVHAGADVVVQTGDGHDEIAVRYGEYDGNLTLSSGIGNDSITSHNTIIHGIASWNTGQGNDTVHVGMTGGLQLDTGVGNDEIQVSRPIPELTTQAYIIAVWMKSDLSLQPTNELASHLSETASIHAGQGDDQVSIYESTYAGDLNVLLGDGDDVLHSEDATITGTVYLDGGPGTNTANDDLFDVNTAGHWDVRGFGNLPISGAAPAVERMIGPRFSALARAESLQATGKPLSTVDAETIQQREALGKNERPVLKCLTRTDRAALDWHAMAFDIALRELTDADGQDDSEDDEPDKLGQFVEPWATMPEL